MGTQPLSDPSNPDHEQWHRDHVLDGLPKPALEPPVAGDGPAPPTPPSRAPSLSDPAHPDHLAWQATHTGGIGVETLPDPAAVAAQQAEADANHKPRKAVNKKVGKKAVETKPAAKKAAPRKASLAKAGVKKAAK